MLIDAHIHCSGRERADQVLATLDEADIDVAVLLAPFLDAPYDLQDATSLRAANRHLAALVSGRRDRLRGFAVVNPRHPDAVADCREALESLGLDGVKLVPSGWFPHDDCARALFDYLSSVPRPVLFHSGIFIDGRSGRYCRPVEFEALRDYPTLKVTLAHLGWPWCDEAIAVGLIDRIKGVAPADCQFRFDLSFGAPPVYRREVLHRALEVLGADLLQFGSDCFLPCDAALLVTRREELAELCTALAVSDQARSALFAGTAARWLDIVV